MFEANISALISLNHRAIAVSTSSLQAPLYHNLEGAASLAKHQTTFSAMMFAIRHSKAFLASSAMRDTIGVNPLSFVSTLECLGVAGYGKSQLV